MPLKPQRTASFSTQGSPWQYFWKRRGSLANALPTTARAQTSQRQRFPLRSPQKCLALRPLPAGSQGWTEPTPSPGPEVTAQKDRAPAKGQFALPLTVCLEISSVAPWVISESSLFLPPACPAPSPAFLENQSCLFALGGYRAECFGIRAAQVQDLCHHFIHSLTESLNSHMYPECQLCIRHCSRSWDPVQNKPKGPPS